MTKEEYFAELRKWYFYGFPVNELPCEWITEAWELPEVQDWLASDGFVRNVSKTGSLCYTRDYLAKLSACLSTEQVRKLYLVIRDACPTREEEFRPEFLVGFARHADAIPPALTREELAALLGFTAQQAEEYFRVVDAHGALPPPRWLDGGGDNIPF